MSQHSPGSKPLGDVIPKLIAAFVTVSSHLVMHQIDVTSAHFATAFNIPVSSTSIYFSKLFSLRSLLIALGSGFEFIFSALGQYRKYYSIICFVIILILRILFLFFLYGSKRLGYHVYVILSIEALFFGFFHSSVIALAPEHSLAIALSANVSRFFILLVQFILDLFLTKNPLLMIKIQTWIGNIFTVCAIFLWITYHFGTTLFGSGNASNESGSSSSSSSTTGSNVGNGQNGAHKQETKGFGETLVEATSPFLMFFAGSMFKDFLFPGVLPYALLETRKCHLINMLVPIANLIGPVCLFALEVADLFATWDWYYNVFWLLAIPMGIIFIYSFLAIHTRIPSARRIVNSRKLVLIETLILVLGNGYLDPLSFSGVAKIDKPPNVITNGTSGRGGQGNSNGTNQGGSGSNGGDVKVITFHFFLALFMRFVFSKLAVGYNDVRVSLGYTLPRFRPRHRMSTRNTFWYILRNVFRRAAYDTASDFKMNIKKYL